MKEIFEISTLLPDPLYLVATIFNFDLSSVLGKPKPRVAWNFIPVGIFSSKIKKKVFEIFLPFSGLLKLDKFLSFFNSDFSSPPRLKVAVIKQYKKEYYYKNN